MTTPRTAEIDKFLEPFQLGPTRLKNRMVMAPMTRNRADERDSPHAMNAQYYAQRAGAGLIITEGSQVSPQGKGYPRTPGIYSDEQVAGWRRITDAVHAKGGKIFLQLWHVGRISHSSFQPQGALPVAPSAIKPNGTLFTETGPQPFVTPRALDAEEIPGIVAQFREGARNAKEAGFDGVEIHGANGYLIDQFLRDGANRRTDAYGGSIENRLRFPLEVVDAVSEVWGSNRVGIRLSPVNPFNSMSDSDPQKTFGLAAETLSTRKLAYLHVVESGDSNFDWAAFRRRYKGTYIANGGYNAARAIASLESGHADLVSFAVLFLANPDLVERFRQSAPLNTPDRATFYGGDQRGYTDYPSFGMA